MDTSQSTRASEVARRRAGPREAWIFALLVLLPPLLYASSYLVIRGNHSLLMTGRYLNLYENGRPSPRARWQNVAITAQRPESKWLEVAFAPLIWTEAMFKVAFGRNPGP